MSSPVLVDTNIVSYLFKRDSRAVPYFRQHLNGRLWVASFMTLAELYRWAVRYQWGDAKRQRLDAYLSRYTIVPYNQALCLHRAVVMDAGRRAGQPIDHADAWIAATALLYDLPLVTHNRKDFEFIDGLQVISD